MDGPSAKKVAVLESWLLVEVRLYFKEMRSGTGC